MRIARTAAFLALVAAAAAAAPSARADGPPGIGECLGAAESSLKLKTEHKLKAARAQLLICSSQACPGEVRQECMKRIAEVNEASATIVLAAKDGAGRELSSVKVSIDGVQVTDHLDGSALPVDPGSHEFKFEVAGQPPVTQTIILHEGEKDRRETVNMGGGAPLPPTPRGNEETGPGPTAGAPPPEADGSTQRLLGIVAGGVGVAGLAVGSIFGLLASSAWSNAKKDCPNAPVCGSQKPIEERSSALTAATISTVGFIAGGVLAGAGVVLFLTAPKSGAPQTGIVARPGGLAVTGTF